MAILKLQNEGETYTGTLTSCQSVQGQYGEQVEFIFVGGDKLFLPKDSADRQLDRLGLDYESANGMALTFSRDHNPKKGAKPYWGIAFAKEGKPATPQAAGPTRVQSPYVPPRETAPPRGVSAGPRIPDMDGPPDWSDVPVPDAEPEPYRAEPPLTPREEREAKGQFDPRPHEAAYLALWSRVAEYQAREGKRLGFPVDGSSVQAATFSIWGLR